MAWTWQPKTLEDKTWAWSPLISEEETEEEKKRKQLEEEKKKQLTYSWQPPEPVEVPKVIMPAWKPPALVQPTKEEQVGVFTDELNRTNLTKLDEPTWGEIVLHAWVVAGTADVQSYLLNLGKLLYEGGVQITDKVTDIFGKDIYDPKKDALRGWLANLSVKSENVAADSWDKIVSKNRLKNIVAGAGRAIPLTFMTLMSGGLLAGAFPTLPTAIGTRAAQMIPFALTSIGSHAKEIEEEYAARGKEAPYLPLLLGSLVGGLGETATEVIPFGAIMNSFGGSKLINRGAGGLLKTYGPAVVNWLYGMITEGLQEVAMVPMGKSINNLLFNENEPLLPMDEMLEAGIGGVAMGLLCAGMGSTSSALRSFTETKVDKMMKLEITRKEGVYDIAEKVIDESTMAPVDKELQKIELEKARVCDKYGLDPKDFKFIELPKGKMEVLPPDEVVDDQLKELQDAGYGIEQPLEGEPTKVNDDKVKVHVLTKDEVVRRMMRAHELGAGYQETAEAIEKGLDEEVPAQPTPLGTRLSGRMQMFMKSIRSSMAINPQAKNVDVALDEMLGTIAENRYIAEQVGDTFREMVPNLGNRELITKYLDMPTKYQAEIAEKGLQDEANWLRRQYTRLGDVALSTGAIKGLWEDYTSKIYKNISEYLKSKRGKTAGASIPVFLGTKFAHGMERTLSTFEEAEALGLIPQYDSALLLQEYMQSLATVEAHKNFVDTVKDMVDEDGHPVAVKMSAREDWAKNYRMVDNPAFARYTVVREEGKPLLTKVPLRWKPEVAAAIEEIATPTYTRSNAARSIRMLKGIIKRLIFMNPAIHGWNIFSDVLDEVNFNFFEAWRAMKPGGKGAQMYLDQPQLVREALRNGLEVSSSGKIAEGLRAEIYDVLPTEGKNILARGIGKLEAWSDNLLWGTIVRNSQIYLYALKRKQGLTPKQAAVYTNDQFGTLPRRYFTKNEFIVTTWLLLARNWTISNLRLLTGALGSIANIIPGKMLTRKGMTNADLQAMAPHYIKHLIKGMFALIVMANLLTKLTTDKWAFENEAGHKLDWNTGLKDNKGRDMYIVMPLLRYMRDYLGWGSAPLRTLYNKTEPLLKTSLELLVNHSVWQSKQIWHPAAPGIDKVKDAAKYAFESWTPFDQFLDSENEVKTTLQRLMPLTGTWIRRGSSIGASGFNTLRTEDKIEFVRTLNPKQINELYGQLAIGRIYGEVAKKLYDFRGKMDYAKEKIDDDIDKLLTGGDFVGAIQLMVESERYKDIGAIRDRILPYLMLSK